MRLFVRFREREWSEFLSFSMALYIRYTTTESSDGFTPISSLPQTYSRFEWTPWISVLERKEDSPDRDTERHQELQLSYDLDSPRHSTGLLDQFIYRRSNSRMKHAPVSQCNAFSWENTVRDVHLLLSTDWPVINCCSHGTILHFSPHQTLVCDRY